MRYSVQFSAEDAITDDERERIHKTGPHTGTFFNTYYIETSPVLIEKDEEDGLNNKYNFTDAYMKGMEELLKLEPRVVAGKTFIITIIA